MDTGVFMAGYEGEHLHFTLDDGSELSGVVSTFFVGEPDTFYYVRTPKMIEFQKFNSEDKYDEMRKICSAIDVSRIVSAEVLSK